MQYQKNEIVIVNKIILNAGDALMLNTKIIGNKIAEARKKINISQAQLAVRLFISSQAVGKWERGESMPDIITFNRLAEILEVDLNYFSEIIKSLVTEIAPGESFVSNRLNHHPESRRKSLAGICHAGTGRTLTFPG